MGVDESGEFLGLEQRYNFSAQNPNCQVRDVAVVPMVQGSSSADECWIGIVSAVACPFEKPKPEYGENEIFYVKGNCDGRTNSDSMSRIGHATAISR